jgi:hypothetical protein
MTNMNIMVEKVFKVIPDYNEIELKSELNFLFGSKEEILAQWNEIIKDFTKDQYLLGCEIKVYEFGEGFCNLLPKYNKIYRMINEKFLLKWRKANK